MTAFTVTARYVLEGRDKGTFDTVVVAKDAEEAARAFKAVHPAGEVFHYVVEAVVPNAVIFA